MRRRHQGRNKEAPELDITAFLNLMVVLVPFLLVSAVFSRVTILELDMPAGAGGGAPDDPTVTVEVVVRKEALEISDGEKVIARFPNLNAGDETADDVQQDQIDQSLQGAEALVVPPTEEVYDLKKLSQFLLQIKGSYPDKTDSILLMEPDIAYEHLVGVMDAVRGVDVREEGADPDDLEAVEHVVLFPDISIGDAP
ncbi:biopolymer transporter ExbD [Microbulbifer thermotolerans]|uniref:Biopolymer transporter ExbD n=1 Tax=Microbulbifer thermotolerans TaxID=252514 RepID=A0AB35HZD1_MICTH|nr:biopolymer transporter ExbD [Microbulbifer thermotolerans]MCX2779278.1 biopolymer transporter ExbD [Microbulbifer thermotolerans]MCX2783976.1 biopolymer transporter ExbD [Microbulbifer thermotolerans]MCX2793497.1 biopolymer transporter ExbD [Microbulbifer thermotolerans]MCX2802690.1 biopolymer transporter ExbD [Microbulbifer thermotolerans]MCX2803702.1 biopolymer transporter ExbD [Microbulbifer thermotolerans]